MTTFIKKIYYSIICYDPIIETLKSDSQIKFVHEAKRQHIASPVLPNRKQKREFYFEYIQSDSSESVKKDATTND